MATPEISLVIGPADIGAHWGIELDASLEPLAPSRALVVQSGACVTAQMSVESIQWEYDLLGFLAPRVPAVIAPLRAVDGSTFLAAGDRVVSVMPYVAAERAERTDPRVRHEVPRLLAKTA